MMKPLFIFKAGRTKFVEDKAQEPPHERKNMPEEPSQKSPLRIRVQGIMAH
jgi:hypothetical protein